MVSKNELKRKIIELEKQLSKNQHLSKEGIDKARLSGNGIGKRGKDKKQRKLRGGIKNNSDTRINVGI